MNNRKGSAPRVSRSSADVKGRLRGGFGGAGAPVPSEVGAARLEAIRQRIDLYRWSDHIEDVAPGSLADVFWNEDVPWLLAAVRVEDER